MNELKQLRAHVNPCVYVALDKTLSLIANVSIKSRRTPSKCETIICSTATEMPFLLSHYLNSLP